MLTVALACQAKDPQLPYDPELRYGTLDNGMTYYIRHANKPAGRADFMLVCKVGSINEADNERGLAHVLEHMSLCGTVNFSESQMQNFYDALGISYGQDVNATTDYDNTIFYSNNVPLPRPTVADTALMILRDLAGFQLIDSADVERQKMIVEGERIERNTADYRLKEQINAVALAGCRYADRFPIGLSEVVNQATPQQLREFYKKWYQPRNMAIIVVGDFDTKRMEQKVKRIMSILTNDPDAPTLPPEAIIPQPQPFCYVPIADEESTANQVSLLVKRPLPDQEAMNTVSFVKDYIIESLLTQIMSQRLMEAASEEGSPLLAAVSSADQFFEQRNVQAFDMSAQTSSQTIPDAISALLTELRRLVEYGIGSKELTRAKNELNTIYISYGSEVDNHPSSEYVDEYRRHYLDGGYIPGVAQEVELATGIIKGISKQDVNKFIKKYFKNAEICLVAIATDPGSLPKESEVLNLAKEIEASKPKPYEETDVAERLMERLPVPGKVVSKDVDSEHGITTLHLSNGITVRLKPTTLKSNEVLFEALAPGGSVSYDSSLIIHASIVDRIFESGRFGGHSIKQLNKILAGKNYELSFNILSNSRVFDGGSTQDDLETLFQMTYLAFTDMQYDAESGEQLRKQTVSILKDNQNNPEVIQADALNKALYGESPYVKMITPEQIENIDFEKTAEFYHNITKPAQQYAFSYVGSFEVDSVIPLIERYIASIPTDTTIPDVPRRELVVRNVTDTVNLVNTKTPDKAHCIVATAFNIERSARNELMMNYLTQMFSAVLNYALREDLNATYGVDCESVFYPETSQCILTYSFDTSPELLQYCFDIAEYSKQYFLAHDDFITDAFDSFKTQNTSEHEQAAQTNNYWQNILYWVALGNSDMLYLPEILRSTTADDVVKFAGECSTKLQATISLLVNNRPVSVE